MARCRGSAGGSGGPGMFAGDQPDVAAYRAQAPLTAAARRG